MIFIRGSNVRQARLGIVADLCPICRRIEAQVLTGYFRDGLIYFIPLGSGTPVGAGRECLDCGTEYECNTARYNQFLDNREVDRLSIRELMEKTNTPLLHRLEDEGRYNPPRRRIVREVRVEPERVQSLPAIATPADLEAEAEVAKFTPTRGIAGNSLDSPLAALIPDRSTRSTPAE